jgi:serine/threonine protein kinase
VSERMLDELQRNYRAGREVDLRALIEEGGLGGSDDVISDLIDADGRTRLERGLAVDLSRYLEAVPALASLGGSLDTAVEMSLRSLKSLGRSHAEATEWLVTRFPGIEREIRTAAMLEDVLCSTGGLRRTLEAGRKLPQAFGPVLREGHARYELRELIGTGAHGAVYLAVDRQLSDSDRPAWVAIKILSRLGTSDEERLADEATKARRIDHPNVVRVLDRGTADDGEPYLAYEYVKAGDLAAYAAAMPGPIPEREAAGLVARLARGLQAAHSAGLAHCDLKPANVLITEKGEPKIADFGVAVRLAGVGKESMYQRIGSLAFVAPEQFRGEPGALSPLADTYAAGGILYWLLTRQYPNGASPEEVHRNLTGVSARSEPPNPMAERGMDADLGAICRRALHPDPKRRYASAEALAADLEAWSRHEPLRWRATTLSRRTHLLARRQPTALALGSGLALALIGGAAAAVNMHQRSVRVDLENRIKLAEQRADADRKRLQNASTVLASTSKIVKSFHENGEDWMPALTIIETIAGPALAGDVISPELRSERIQIARKIVSDAAALGVGRQLNPMLWETVLGYWLLRSGETVEAGSVLEQSRAHWLELGVAEGDPWIGAIDALRGCVSAREAIKAKSDEGMRAAAAALEAAALRTGTDKYGRLVRRMVLQTQSDLYGPEGLNDSGRYMQTQEELKTIK